MTTYRHFLSVHEGQAGAVSSYPKVNWKFAWDSTSTHKLFTITTIDSTETVYMGRLLQQADDTYDTNGGHYYADNSLTYSDNFKVEHVSSSTGEHLFRLSQGSKSLKVLNTYTSDTGTPEDAYGYTDGMGVGPTPTDVIGNEAYYFILKNSSGSGITWSP